MGTTKVTVPTGCAGLDMADGTRYDAPKQGTQIEVADEHASAIRRGWYGDTGVIATSPGLSFGTKRGRRCRPCNRLWNAWSLDCPRCERPTVEELA